MSHVPVNQGRKNDGADPRPPARPPRPERAFDTWLARGLHRMFDDVAREPVPDELLRILGEEPAAGRK